MKPNKWLKALSCVLALMLAVSCLTLSAFAEGNPEPSPTPSAKDAEAPYLTGYALTQTNGQEIPGELTEGQRCNVIFRITDPALVGSGIDVSRICTKLNCSSFTFTGLGEISHYEEETGTFIALFRDAIYNGRSDEIVADLWYTDSNLPVRHVNKTFGALNTDPSAGVSHTSNIIVRDVDYGGEVVAGQPFTLKLTLFSSIGEENINDIIVRLGLPEDITILSGSESGYIASMAPRSTATVSFVLQPKVNIDKTTVQINLDINGTGAVSYSPVSAAPSISIPITQPIRFEFTNLEAPGDLMVGMEDMVYATYVNKGKTTLSNVTATLTGSNLVNGEQSQYLGNVESGSEKSVEFSISALEAGSINGLLTLTYEDSNGQEQSISRSFSCSVEEMPVYNNDWEDIPMEEPTPAGPPIWLYALLGLLVILGGFLGFRAWKRHAKKKAAAKAAEDDDSFEEEFQYHPLPSANEGSTHEVR